MIKINYTVGSDKVSEEVGLKILSGIHEEAQEFMNEVKAKIKASV